MTQQTSYAARSLEDVLVVREVIALARHGQLAKPQLGVHVTLTLPLHATSQLNYLNIML